MKRLILSVAFVLFAFPVWAATPTHDATTNSGALSNVTNPSYSHTPSGSACPNSVAIISVAWQDTTPGTISSVTYGGSAATSLGAAANCAGCGGNRFVQMFIYKNSGTSSATVQVNFSESINAASIRTGTYCNVDQTTSTGTRATASNSTTTITVDVTSAVGELVVDAAVSNVSVCTVGAGQTQRIALEAGSPDHYGSDEAGAATVTMSWTSCTGQGDWAIIGIPLKPSSNSRRAVPAILF